MILIEITGETFPWREKYKSLGFKWRPEDKTWWLIETEAGIQNTMESLRNQWIGQKVKIQLRIVDIYGNPQSERVVTVERLAVASAEREVVDWLKEVRHTITNGCKIATSPAKPLDSFEQAEQEKKGDDVHE